MIFEIDQAEELLGYEFKDKLLLRQCFTHASYAHEHEQNDNEVLEFFGDSVLQFVVTEYLFKERYANEGKLTELRKDLVAKEPLLRIVKKMGLHELLLLGKGATRGNLDEKLYSSLYEAVVAGIYIDGGMDCARRFIKDTLIKDYNEREKAKPKKKTAKKHLPKKHLQRKPLQQSQLLQRKPQQKLKKTKNNFGVQIKFKEELLL